MQSSGKSTRQSPRKCTTEHPTKNIEPSSSKVKKAIDQDHSYPTDPMEPTDASKELSTLQNAMRILKQKEDSQTEIKMKG